MTQPARQPSTPDSGRAPQAIVQPVEPPPERQERDARLAALVAAAAAGDAGAFEAFYEQTFAFARTVARRLLHDTAEVEDLLADCYFEAWRTAARFDPARGSAVTWLLTLVRSRGVDALRAAAARPDRPNPSYPGGGALAGAPTRARDAGAAADGSETEAEGPTAAATADPAEALWQRQSGTQLHAALARLSAPERWVLGLAYLRDLSHTEIAQCTGMPLGTVKSHALRAQNKLRATLAAALGPALVGPGAPGTRHPPP